DNTSMPPKQIATLKVRDQPGWVTFSIDGTHAWPSTGEVFDVKSKKVIASLTDEDRREIGSEKLLEIDFDGDKPIRNGDQFGIGRVIGPDSSLDAVRHVGISGGIIRAVAVEPLSGRTVVDASGLVVAPGFIDLHQHAQRTVNAVVDGLKAMDGVTTALELEVGTDDIDRWYAARAGKSLINYGASIGHIPSRIAAMKDPGEFLPSGPAAHRAATAGEI